MSLSVAYNTARSSLQASQSQMAIVSRNLTGASDPSYSRKIGALVTQGGAARVVTLRASDSALLSKMLETTSDAATQKALLEGLEKLSQTVGDTELDASPAARIGALNSALRQYANAPDNQQYARAFVTAANDMASSLNQATAAVQAVRLEADGKIADSVARINDILAKFEKANQQVVSGTALGVDVTDALDVRDGLIAQLSEEIGVTVVPRAGNDIALYTDSGVPLFDKTARAVTFDRTTVYAPGTTGLSVYIDGIQVTGQGALMPLHSGNLVGLATIRDEVAVTYQSQLDELARGLIEAFAEVHQSNPLAPKLPGVFTFAGATGVPTMPATAGLAGLITVTDEVDPAKSATGRFENIRDGGINGAAYRYNPNPDNAAFFDRLYGLLGEMAAERPFDPSLGLGVKVPLQEFASSSASWVEFSRQSANQSLEYRNTLLGHASEALSNATDVNVDDETALMLQLEKSYSASAKLISVIDQMIKTLLNAVG
jgi:flagellar hook-associated protein 1 FlgK